MKRISFFVAILSLFTFCASLAEAAPRRSKRRAKVVQKVRKASPAKKSNSIARDPYIGAIVLDADTGETLFEDRADIPGYPASTLKLMTLYVILEKIGKGEMKLTDICPVSVRAYKTGGSQVYLDPKESFPVEDLLYALMIQSANDAAVALAEKTAGSVEAFVSLMNQTAQEMGMENTRFSSVHGLPPGKGQKNDVTTARDMAILCRALCRNPAAFTYTSAAFRVFRANTPKPFEMRTHNPFLKEKMAGCDGLKTGYTASAGWSIAVSCKREKRRILVYVLGSTNRKLRDAKARELLSRFAQ